MNDINFWENSIKEGFYDKTIEDGLKSQRDVQSQWHDITYKNVLKKKGNKFYLANDFKLALKLGLDGVYLPSFNKKFNHLFNKSLVS